MPEPITTVGLSAIAAYLSKDGLQRLLGPTADYLGEGLRDLTQKRMENIGRIFQKADHRLGEKRNTEGTVPPKVLKTIINDGSYNDDNIAVEYFGGVLASSRTELGRDDRGARMAKIIDGLSTYQLRTHFLIYSTIRETFKANKADFNMSIDRSAMEIYFSFPHYVNAMEFSPSEIATIDSILSHIIFGLHNDGLIEDFLYGPSDDLVKRFKRAKHGGIIVRPSALGAELYLWAFGAGDKPLNFLFSDGFHSEIEGILSVVADSVAIKEA